MHFWLKSYLCFCRVWMKLMEVEKILPVSGSFWSNFTMMACALQQQRQDSHVCRRNRTFPLILRKNQSSLSKPVSLPFQSLFWAQLGLNDIFLARNFLLSRRYKNKRNNSFFFLLHHLNFPSALVLFSFLDPIWRHIGPLPYRAHLSLTRVS